MNNKNQKLVPICLLAAVLIMVAILYARCWPKIEEIQSTKQSVAESTRTRETLKNQMDDLESQRALNDMKMKNLKTIVETNVSSNVENLGIFGNLFETIVSKAQKNGLLIRAIEYNLNPASDPIFQKNPDGYNVCELKLSLVGGYNQLRAFIADLNGIEHLIYLSKLNVTAFSENTDYLLIHMSINLYSKKSNASKVKQQPFAQK